MKHIGAITELTTISGATGTFSNSLTISGVPVPIKTSPFFVPFVSTGWILEKAAEKGILGRKLPTSSTIQISLPQGGLKCQN